MDNEKLNRKKQKATMKDFRRAVKSLKAYRLPIVFSVVLAVVSVVLSIFIPKILGDITNIAIATFPEVDFATILQKVGLVLGLLLPSALAGYIQNLILVRISAKYTRNLRNQIFDKIAKLPIAYFDKHQYGDTLSRMTNDIETINNSMSTVISNLATSVTTLIGTMVIMLSISLPLSLVAFIVVPLSVLVVGKIMGRAQKFFLERQNMLGKLNSEIEEDYSGLLIIKSNSHEMQSKADFDEANEKLAKVTAKAQFLSSLSFPVTHIFTNFGYAAVVILGGVLTINGALTIGALQAFVQYVSRFNRPITEVASSTSMMQGLLAATQRIFQFLDETEEAPDFQPAKKIEKIKGEVGFHNVNFSYEKDKPVITDFSVKVKPGMKVAIVGPTGAGKTTIINLLMRFYEPTSGYITIDGTPIAEMQRTDERKLFGMVLQDTWLFNGTVEENLRYGKHSATHADIVKAAKAANVHHVIEALPKGYKTEISEDSDNISAGEKQLLTIARAMVADPPMMILDEATSNVDTRTEQMIQDSFEKLTTGRTSFVIAHRLSTIRNSDLILVMKDGNIIEQGNHDTLLALGGFYAELYNSQFADT
ncbi:ABC transporter ATP-binding protein [Candidatus Saccharibacteria bacterium]|nr:ABC transporter ATP-binding protein [Candidatus Saccharibacteria bacterium]